MLFDFNTQVAHAAPFARSGTTKYGIWLEAASERISPQFH
jgi:hypothetical protein